MRQKTIKRILLPALCLLLVLTACSRHGPDAADDPTAPTAAPAPWRPEIVPEIAGEESAPPAEPAGETDGLEGSYYNDYLRETLILDGCGGCSVSWPGGVMGGVYSAADEVVTVLMSDLRLTARRDACGDLSIDGKTGRYLRDWDFWGITTAEAGIHPVTTLPDTEEFPLGGGAYRYRDFPAGLALTYNEALQIAAGKLSGAVTVADGKGGYVVGRNVTRDYLTRSGSAKEFMEDYIRATVFQDCGILYGAVGAYDGLRLLSGKTEGRLAAGELTLTCGTQEIAARVILYTSAFSDGTENFICKCVLAPSGETAQLDALAAGVYDMGAARIVQTT